MADDAMSSRDFILLVGQEMKRTPDQMERFITALENDFIDSVAQIRDLSDDQFKQIGFPIGLVNTIRKKLSETAAGAQAAAPQMINTGGAAATTMINTIASTSGLTQGEGSRLDRETVTEMAMRYLDNLQESDILISDPVEKKAKVKLVVTTLFKVISNVLTSPFEQKFRRLPRHSATVQ